MNGHWWLARECRVIHHGENGQRGGTPRSSGGKPGMADVGTRAPRFSLRDITNYQWLVLFVAWAGWSLDITDFTLYGLVLRQSLTELLGSTTPLPEVLKVGGIITTIGLLGLAVGGIFFGIVADYFGP